MDALPVQYVQTSDGYDIAYAVAGQGRPFVNVPGQFSHVQENWSRGTFQTLWLKALASRFKLVYYDGRGQGMSTRPIREPQTIESVTRDLEAVVEHLDLQGIVLMARWYAAHIAIRYAVRYPERLAALILLAPSVDNAAFTSAIYEALPAQNWDAFLLSQMPRNGSPLEVQRKHTAFMKELTTKEDLAIRTRAYTASRVDEELTQIAVPTLVLHPRDYPYLAAEEAMRVASRIPGSRMVVTPGEMMPDTSNIPVIEDFLNSVLPAQPSGLTRREAEVLRLLAAGKTNQQIAGDLSISVSTVLHHVTSILTKTETENRTEAAAFAHRLGIT